MKRISLLSAGAAVLLVATPAFAQKSKDSARIAFFQPMNAVDAIFDPRPESSLLARQTYDHLIGFDADTRKFKPLLAESWSRPNPTTIELKLRKDVKFHNGSQFDADDVVYTIGMAIDPKVNFRFKGSRFGWIKSVEKIDQFTVRIHSKGVVSTGIGRLATQPPIYPSDYHATFAKKSDFGRKPVGTGPYRVASVNKNRGAVLVRNDNYALAGTTKPGGKIKQFVIKPVPDAQTQLANMMVSELDMIYAVKKDIAEQLVKNPNLRLSVQESVAFSYVMFDVRDRSKIGHFKDKRVREALLRAIDRKTLAKSLVPDYPGRDNLQQALCHPWHIACDSSASPVSYDPARAKKLLAEAGLKDGFKVEITTWGPSTPFAEAVAGQWRKVGVDATVDRLSILAFIKKRAQGKVQANVTLWDNGVAQPDIDTTAGFFFLPGSRNMSGDKALTKAVFDGRKELDIEKRKAIYRAAFDRVTNEYYAMPVVPLPAVVVHHKDIKLLGGHKNPKGFEFNRMEWN